MASIYFIRHGQASFGKDNYDQLSELGHQQSARLGESLKARQVQFDCVISGDLQRHRETAEQCLGAMDNKSDLEIDHGWNEYRFQEILRVYRPEFENSESMRKYISSHENPMQFFKQEFANAVDRWASSEHDGDYSEPWSEFLARMEAAYLRVIEKVRDHKSIAVFTSGGPVSFVSQKLFGIDQRRIMQMNWALLNCGVTKVVQTSDQPMMSSWNDHSHFEHDKQFITYT